MEQGNKWDLKAPLRNSWTLWFHDGNETTPLEERLVQVGSFSTREGYWGFHNIIKPVSSISHGCDFSLFRTGVRPIWDDEANRNGGRWLIELDKNLPPQQVDERWLDTTMSMISQIFAGQNSLISGATISLRANGHSIGLWLRDSNNEYGRVMEIGLSYKELLGFGPNQILKFQTHLDIQNPDESGEIRTTHYV